MGVKSICIVGGGSAGWMTAIALSRALPYLDVTLIESTDIGTIGVGEATQPYVSTFLKEYMGLEEKDWMKQCDATFKASLRFNNFNNTGKNDKVYHTFWSAEESQHSVSDWGIRKYVNSDIPISNYTKTFYKAHSMCESNKFDRREGEGFIYAHHLDATKFGKYCRGLSSTYGINRIEGTVESVETDEQGITGVRLKGSADLLTYDLYIDCTGFSAILIEKTLGSKFTSIVDDLINDSAIAIRVPYKDKKEEIRNYTDCTALSSGWSWQVPLWGRMGCGYVYSSSFISDTDAKKELSDHIAGTLGVSDLEDSDFKVIRLRTGYRDRSWEKNCISIGLSSQFLEPLESTGLVFVVNQIRSLISLLDSKNLSYNEFSRATYNYESKKFFEEAKYFVLMHYLNTSRDDSEYWKHIKEQRVPEYLLTLISNITNKGDWEVEYNRMFHQKSWEHIMVGFKGIDFTKNLYIGGEPINLVTQKEDIREILEHLKSLEISNSETVNEMSTHYDYLMENLYGNDSDSR